MISIILPERNEKNYRETAEKCLMNFPNAQVIVSHDQDGRGKGWALRQGYSLAEGNVVIFLDGDGDIDPRMIDRLLPFLGDYDVVVGYKPPGGSLSRRLLTRFSRAYIKALFGIKVTTQTGIKVFRRHTIPSWETNGYACDIEILAKCQKNGYRMAEVLVEAKSTKKMGFKHIVQTLKDSIKIWLLLIREQK